MKKLSIILDETTILNFPFLWLLIWRYKYISLITPVIGGVLALYFYFSQNLIMTVSLGFKSVSSEDNSPSNAISKVLGETKTSLSPQEIVAMASSSDFYNKVAHAIVDHAKYETLNLNNFDAKKIFTIEELLESCHGDKTCKANELGKRLSRFISVRHDMLVENKFYVDVKTLDFFTSHIVAKIVSQEIVNTRINAMKRVLSEQSLITKELLTKKSAELNSTNFTGLSNELQQVLATLQTMSGRLASLGLVYESKKLELSKMDITLQQTESTMSAVTSDEERERYNQEVALTAAIRQTVQDIHAMELNKGALSVEDKGILEQLKVELKNKKLELSRVSKVKRSIANADQFLEAKDKASNFTDFDYKVAKQEFIKLQNEYGLLKAEHGRFFNRKIEIEQKLEELKPSFEYLKLLEGKQVQLELLASTVVSDLIFEELPSNISHFKRASKEKIGIFSILLTIFVMFGVLLSRYAFDSRIYNEMELKRNFENVPIIGNTPDFN